MIIEYDVVCFERTLTIHFKDKYEPLRDTILELLDRFYTFWHNTRDHIIQCTCLEEFMATQLDETGYTWEEWESIPYGDNYEPRETMWVCEHCLMGIESHEGNQATLEHYVDEDDAVESKCDWCKQCGFYTLYELV